MKNEKPRLLVVDDDESIRTQMKWALIQDYDVYLAMDADKAMELVKSVRPPLITLDLGLPPEPESTSVGFKLLKDILSDDPLAKVMVVTGNSERSSALEAVSLGAHDFFTKPVDIDELKAILRRAFYVHSLEVEHRELRSKVGSGSFGDMVGTSPIMQEVFSVVRKVSTTDVPVLITGESGTGKELIARAVHANGERREKPFVPINCGAIPENLMESELFGHEKGAFTGAHAKRKGKIELASSGTLFLDEIGELPLPLQVKLLRFLQDHRFERIGGRETFEADIRVIAASNKKLKDLIETGEFREDLYYRIAVVTIDLPPLRDRGDDRLMLARTFLQRFSDDATGVKSLSAEAEEFINSYQWPGNVRELENSIKRAITFSDGALVSPADLGFSAEDGGMTGMKLKEAKEELEKRLIDRAVSVSNGNIKKAAEELGITRPTLYSLMKKYGMTKDAE